MKKYESEYISYIYRGDSAAVLITRDVVKSINTHGKWIDILSTKGKKNRDNQWDFKEIIIEIFPRKIHPVYPKHSSDEDIKYITWKTAQTDIFEQRKAGNKGVKYKITLKLINMNKDKYKVIDKVWNKTFERFVPRDWITPACEIRKCKVPIKPKWEYHILSIQKL